MVAGSALSAQQCLLMKRELTSQKISSCMPKCYPDRYKLIKFTFASISCQVQQPVCSLPLPCTGWLCYEAECSAAGLCVCHWHSSQKSFFKLFAPLQSDVDTDVCVTSIETCAVMLTSLEDDAFMKMFSQARYSGVQCVSMFSLGVHLTTCFHVCAPQPS